MPPVWLLKKAKRPLDKVCRILYTIRREKSSTDICAGRAHEAHGARRPHADKADEGRQDVLLPSVRQERKARVAIRQAEAYREATENYRMFMDAVNAHVDELTEQTAKAIRKEAEQCKGKAGGSKSAPRGSRRGS